MGWVKKYFFKIAKISYPLIHIPNTKKPEKGKILIISEVGGLGDAILFRRVLEAIKEKYDIYLITRRYHLPAYEDIIKKENLFIVTSTSQLFQVSKRLKKEGVDILLLHGLSIISFVTTFIFFRKIGYKIGIFAEQAKGFLNKSFIAENYDNVLDIYADLTSYLGGTYSLLSFDKYKHYPIQKTTQVSVYIGSGSLCKNWRIKNFIELFKLFDGAGIKYAIIGSTQDLEIVKPFLNQFPIRPTVIDSFLELTESILGSQVVICHNTSILHLAVALGTKTISFNSKSNYTWWNPSKNFPTKEHIAFKASDRECGYSQQFKSLLLHKNKCGCSLFDSIKPEMVFTAVNQLLSQSSEQ